MNKGFDIAINFLFYSYFKITLDSSVDTIIERAIDKAYSDATNQKAFNALTKIGPNGREKDEGTNVIRAGIKEVLDKPSKFNEIHKKVCNDLVEKYKHVKSTKDTAFSYGNAQKWFNMTMKYLYVISNIFLIADTKNGNFTSYAKKISDLSAEMHGPVDSYILEAVWDGVLLGNDGKDDKDKFNKSVLPNVNPLNNGTYGKYSYEKIKPWSQWNYDDYHKFQTELRDAVSGPPIEWEGPAWIKIAKKRNGKNKSQSSSDKK